MLNLNRSFDKLRMTKSLPKCIKTIDMTLSFRAQPRNLLKTNPRSGLNYNHAQRTWFYRFKKNADTQRGRASALSKTSYAF
jgi:hypothetical protein